MPVLIRILLLFAAGYAQNICSNFTQNLAKIYQCVNVDRSLVTFTILTGTQSSANNIGDFLNSMLSEMSALESLVYIKKLDIDFEDNVIEYSELYSWRGEYFKLRKAQENKTITYDGISAAHPYQRFREASSASVVVIAENIDILLEYLVGSPRSPFQSTRKVFNIVLLEKPENVEEKVSMVLGRMWRNYGIMIAVLVFTCDDNIVNYMDQLSMKPGKTNATDYDSWGILEKAVVDVNLSTICNRNVDNFQINLNGYPLRVLLFEEDPVSISWDRFPESFKRGNLGRFQKLNPITAGYNGFTVAGLVDFLNFTPIYILPDKPNYKYGYKTEQGIIEGSMRVAYSKYDFVGMLHFVTGRQGMDYDYLHPVCFDKYCVIAPKAKRVPLHLAFQNCFTPSSWLIIMAIPWVSTFVLKALEYKKPYKEISLLPSNTFCLVIYFYFVMISTSTNIRTKAQTDRWILSGCMTFSIIFVTIFGANLTSYLTTDIRFSEIDSLEDLADSNLKINVNSPSMISMAFGTADSSNDPVMKKLKSNLVLGNDSIYKVVAGENCVIRQMLDFGVINKKIVAEFGEKKLHLVNECPSAYHTAFLVRRGWCFTSLFNRRIQNLLEAGFVQYWQKFSTHGLELTINKQVHANEINGRNVQLTISDSYIWFAAVLIGEVFGILIFCCELWWFRMNKAKN